VRANGEYLIEDLVVRKLYRYKLLKDGSEYDSNYFTNENLREIFEQPITFSK
jgi:hypothetical protein